jgi:hypothetical protein
LGYQVVREGTTGHRTSAKFTPAQPHEAAETKQRIEFLRLSRLNENIGKSDQEMWDTVMA